MSTLSNYLYGPEKKIQEDSLIKEAHNVMKKTDKKCDITLKKIKERNSRLGGPYVKQMKS